MRGRGEGGGGRYVNEREDSMEGRVEARQDKKKSERKGKEGKRGARKAQADDRRNMIKPTLGAL